MGKEEADTEDLFDTELFAGLLNKSYALTGDQALTAAKLDVADSNTVRIVKKAEAYFRLLPEDIPMLDHYHPAEWLIENPSFLDGESAILISTLERAESLAQAINELLTG